jgi:hypothetical protein
MTRPRTSRLRVLAVVPVTALAAAGLAACGGDDADDAADTTATTSAPATQPADDTTTTAAGGGDTTASTAAPAPTGCQRLDPSPDDVYQVADAGEVEVRREGNSLVLGEIRPADGWTHTVDDQGDDEIEIDFRSNGREVDIEFEIEGDRLDVEVCVKS